MALATRPSEVLGEFGPGRRPRPTSDRHRHGAEAVESFSWRGPGPLNQGLSRAGVAHRGRLLRKLRRDVVDDASAAAPHAGRRPYRAPPSRISTAGHPGRPGRGRVQQCDLYADPRRQLRRDRQHQVHRELEELLLGLPREPGVSERPPTRRPRTGPWPPRCRSSGAKPRLELRHSVIRPEPQAQADQSARGRR